MAFILYGIGRTGSEYVDLEDELAQLSEAFPAVPVILLSDVDTAANVLGAIKKGVRGFIQTSLTLDLVVEATHVVQAGGSFVQIRSSALYALQAPTLLRARGGAATSLLARSRC